MTIVVDNKALVTEASESSRKGFTLTEIAIVLGIIGLILSAIWVAANAVYNNMRVNRAETELLQVAQAVKAFYANSSTVDATANMSPALNGNTDTTYIHANIFPSDTITSGTGANNVATTTPVNPWGGAIYVRAATQVNTNDSFMVGFSDVPLQACIDLIMTAIGGSHDASIFGWGVGAAGAVPGAFNAVTINGAVAPGTVNTACTENGSANAQISNPTASVAIEFSLRAS